MQPFGPWAPDRYDLGTGQAGEALNVLPGTNSYRPWPQMEITSLALAAACKGAFAARTASGSLVIFAGTATALYKFAGIGTAWSDVTRLAGGAYAVGTDRFWSFVQYGSLLIAANGVDAIQYIDIDSGTNFDALGGSPPVTFFLKVVGPFLMLANTATSTRQVRWSGREDPDFFTTGSKDSDEQTFPDGGFVQGVTALEQAGLVIQTDAVRRFIAVPDRRVFTFHRVEDVQGTRSPYSIIPHKGSATYYGVDGFVTVGIDGQSREIGKEWVDDWFRDNSSGLRPTAIVGAFDPARNRYIWLFPSNNNASSTTLDRAICWDPASEKQWTHAEINAEYIFPAASPGATLSDLASLYGTLAAVPYPLGSEIWLGGLPGLGAFDSAHKLNLFTGAPMAATLQTPLFKPIPGRRCFVNGFRPVGDAANVTGRVATTERPGTAESFTATSTMNTQGVVRLRASGQYLRAEITVAASEDWDHLAGVDWDDDLIKPAGYR